MTPLNLQQALREDMQRLFKGFVDINQQSEPKQITFYENSTPILLDGQNADDIYPYGVVRVMSGVVPEALDTAPTVKAVILLGYYDNDMSNDGNKYLMTAINKIVERFCENHLLDKYYNQVGDIEWTLSDEDTSPYYFGGLELNFTLPIISRESEFC